MEAGSPSRPRRPRVVVAPLARPRAGGDLEGRAGPARPRGHGAPQRVHPLRALVHLHQRRRRRGSALAAQEQRGGNRPPGARLLALRRPPRPVQRLRRGRPLDPHRPDRGAGGGRRLRQSLRRGVGPRDLAREVQRLTTDDQSAHGHVTSLLGSGGPRQDRRAPEADDARCWPDGPGAG
ncbi:hypothetical protein SBRY_50074 [Actinacidiphila bryophytorum]|uniref:Uncharacterized protein n=1 Tax=Actinacidiphila bryophytorum TaxID=1436133 RepID=A0A9W4H475_9ACTN|nr:hypothetical protein SBRY_50074 [Actinacidiphila bryophytorum]